MPDWQLREDEDGQQWLLRMAFYDFGLDDYAQPPAQNPDLASSITNILLGKDGTLRRWWGDARWDSGPASALAAQPGRVYQYTSSDGATVRVLAIGDESTTKKAKTWTAAGASKNTNIYTISGSTHPRAAISRGYAYLASGHANDRAKYNGNDVAGNGVTSWGITAPSAAVTAAASGTGSLSIRFWRDYTVAFRNSTTGHISDIGPFKRVSGFTGKTQIDVSVIPTGAATEGGLTTGTNQRVLLATSDGGPRTRLYLVAIINDNTTTTYTDTTTDATLLNADIYVEVDEFGVSSGILDNSRPPTTAAHPTLHRGRLFLIDGQDIVFSKSLVEVSTSTTFEIGGRWEESFPADYRLQVSRFGDALEGLKSDGDFLYIGSKRAIYRLAGYGPETFRPPEVLFDHAGIWNIDVWVLLPVGTTPYRAMWLTPDRKVILSDFVSYINIGTPILGTLRGMNVSVAPFATYCGYDDYNLYLLTIEASGSVIQTMAFDIDRQRWTVYKPPFITPSATFYWVNLTDNVGQLLLSHSVNGNWYKVSRTAAQSLKPADDTAQDMAISFTTSFLDFGFPLQFKVINVVDFVKAGANSGTLQLQGATTNAQLKSPASIGSFTQASTIRGETRIQTAASSSGYRWHRFAWTMDATDSQTVDSTEAVFRSLALQFVVDPLT